MLKLLIPDMLYTCLINTKFEKFGQKTTAESRKRERKEHTSTKRETGRQRQTERQTETERRA